MEPRINEKILIIKIAFVFIYRFPGTSKEKLEGVFDVIKGFDAFLTDETLIEAVRAPQLYSGACR